MTYIYELHCDISVHIEYIIVCVAELSIALEAYQNSVSGRFRIFLRVLV